MAELDLPSAYVRSCIEVAWEATRDDGPTYLSTLKGLRLGHYETTSTGYLVTATSQGGISTSVSIPVNPQDRNRITPATLQVMWQLVIEAYRAAASNFGPEDSLDVGANGFIDYLLSMFETIPSQMLDSTMLRYPTYGLTR